MSSFDDHCIITKYELTEKEKQLKKSFFRPIRKAEEAKKQNNSNAAFKENQNDELIKKIGRGNNNINDELLNKLIKENVDPIVNQNLKYLSNRANKAEAAFLPLNIIYNQNRILERNVDVLQETQRSLKDFFIYNLQNNHDTNNKVLKKSISQGESLENKKFFIELLKPLYQNMESIKNQVNNISSQKRDIINNGDHQESQNELHLLQKNLKNSTSKVEQSLNLVKEHTNQAKKDSELFKMIEEIKGGIVNVHKEMNKLESDVNENFKKIYEETQKKNLMQMFSNNRKNTSNLYNNFNDLNFNNNKNSDLFKNSKNEDEIDYTEFKKSLCDINLRTQEIKNEYETSKAKIKINMVHKFEKADKIDFSYDIDFKDPFSFNSFTTNDDSLIANNIQKERSQSNKKNFIIKNKNLVSKLSKKIPKENKPKDEVKSKIIDDENVESTDNELFHASRAKKNNVFLDHLNKSIDKKEEKPNSNKYKNEGNINKSTDYTLKSPSMANNTLSLIKSTPSTKNKNNKNNNIISIINEDNNESDKNKCDEILEKVKNEYQNKNKANQDNKKGLKEILEQAPDLDQQKNDKRSILKDVITKVLIEKIIVDKNKQGENILKNIPISNDEMNLYLRDKDYNGKFGSGKYFDLDLDEKSAREVTEKILREKIKLFLNKKRLSNLLKRKNEASDNVEAIKSDNLPNKIPEDQNSDDILEKIENKLFNKLNLENSKRDKNLNDNFNIVLNRLVEMEKNMQKFPLKKMNIEKLDDSQYIEIDKTHRNKVNDYDEMIDKITEKIKSNMHITINLNDGKNNSNNIQEKKQDIKLDLQTESLNILAENNNLDKNKQMGYTHPFANRNKILKMLDIENYNYQYQNIPLPHTINFKDYEITSESSLTESKRSEMENNKATIDNNDLITNQTKLNSYNNYSINPNILYLTNISKKIDNFPGKFVEDQVEINSYQQTNKMNNNAKFSNEKHLLEANLLATEIQKLKNNISYQPNYRDESISEGQVVTISNVNDTDLESIYAQSQNNLKEPDTLIELNHKILLNKKKIEELNTKNFAQLNGTNKFRDEKDTLNLNDLKNINKDLEHTLQKYNQDNQYAIDITSEENEKYESSNINENSNDIENNQEYKFNLGKQDIREKKDFNNINSASSQQMDQKIQFLKANNLYDSEEQMNFQKTFQNVLKKNNINNQNSNNTSQSSNFHNTLKSFNNNNLPSLGSSGNNKIMKQMILGGKNQNNLKNNQVYLSFGGNVLNANNQQSNRSQKFLQKNNVSNSDSYIYMNNNIMNSNKNLQQENEYNQQSNISSYVNSERMQSDQYNISDNTDLDTSNNFYNQNFDKYYGYNNTISENHTESVDSAIDKKYNNLKNNKIYKTDESSIDR